MSIHLSIYEAICQFIYLPFCLSIILFIYLSIYVSTYLCLFNYLSIYISFDLSIYQSISLISIPHFTLSLSLSLTLSLTFYHSISFLPLFPHSLSSLCPTLLPSLLSKPYLFVLLFFFLTLLSPQSTLYPFSIFPFSSLCPASSPCNFHLLLFPSTYPHLSSLFSFPLFPILFSLLYLFIFLFIYYLFIYLFRLESIPMRM